VRAARLFRGLTGMGVVLAACTQAPEAIATVSPPPRSSGTALLLSALPEPSSTLSPPSALAPPGGPVQTLHASPTRSGENSQPSLASIIETERAALMADADMNLLPAIQPAPVALEYTSELRALAPETMGFLWQFGVSFDEQEFATQFRQELLLREGDLEFWMPIEERVVSYMAEELEAGELVIVYVRLLGSLRTDVGHRVIFIITDVQE